MPAPSTFALFAVAALALLVVPGPAVLYVVTRSLDQGRRAGLVSVLGIHTGSVVHVVAATLGASAVLARSATAFGAVRLIGGAYLVWLGVRRLRARTPAGGALARGGLPRAYREGVVVNVLNPKTAVFFLAFLPQFVDPRRGSVAAQVLLLGLCFIGLGICSDGAYALAASALGRRLHGGERFARRRDRLSGAVYIGLGLIAAVVSRRTVAGTH